MARAFWARLESEPVDADEPSVVRDAEEPSDVFDGDARMEVEDETVFFRCGGGRIKNSLFFFVGVCWAAGTAYISSRFLCRVRPT